MACRASAGGFGWFVRDVEGVRGLAHNGFVGSSICYLTVDGARTAVHTRRGGSHNRGDLDGGTYHGHGAWCRGSAGGCHRMGVTEVSDVSCQMAVSSATVHDVTMVA